MDILENKIKADAYEIALHQLETYIQSGLLKEEYQEGFKVARTLVQTAYMEALEKQ